MLGERVKNELNAQGITPTITANFIGISEGNLYKLFKKDSFEIAYLLKIAELTGKNLNYFIEDDSKNLENSQKSEKSRPFKTRDRPMSKGEDYSELINSLKRENEILLKNNESLLKDKERLWNMIENNSPLGKRESNEQTRNGNLIYLDTAVYKGTEYKMAV